jgi:prevent-host-death family protein
MPENIVSLTEFKSNTAKFIAELRQHSQSLVLTQNGRATVVVQDMATYQRQLDAIAILKLVAVGESDIKKKRLMPQKQIFSNLKKQLKDNSRE